MREEEFLFLGRYDCEGCATNSAYVCGFAGVLSQLLFFRNGLHLEWSTSGHFILAFECKLCAFFKICNHSHLRIALIKVKLEAWIGSHACLPGS